MTRDWRAADSPLHAIFALADEASALNSRLEDVKRLAVYGSERHQQSYRLCQRATDRFWRRWNAVRREAMRRGIRL